MTISLGLSAVIALHHRCVHAESAGQHGRCEHKHRYDKSDHAARRPNSVNSPPHSIVPPAMAMPIRPIAYATGPVREVAMVCIGRSHGRFPAAAACSRMLEAQTSTASAPSREPSEERLEMTLRFMNLTSRLFIGC